MTGEEKNIWLEAKVREIGEHFDCVQILASEVMDSGATQAYYRGSGNWYARVGLAREMVDRDQFQTQEFVRRGIADANDD